MPMKPSSKDRIKGKARKVKGKVKEAIGRANNDPDMEAEGTVEKAQGYAQEKLGQVKRVFEK